MILESDMYHRLFIKQDFTLILIGLIKGRIPESLNANQQQSKNI